MSSDQGQSRRKFRTPIGAVLRSISEKSDKVTVTLFKSMFTSSIAFALDFSLLAFLVEIAGIYYLLSNIVSFLAGSSLSYVLSIALVFHSRTMKRKSVEYAAFIFIGVIGVVLNSLFLWLLTSGFGIHYMLSKVIAGSTVFFWNFFARKFMLFRGDPIGCKPARNR